MEAKEQEAIQVMTQADKLANSGKGFFSKIFGSGHSSEEACEKYVRAANLFKISKKWSAAGNAFSKSAEIQVNQLQNKYEGASNLIDAGNCYRKSDVQEAIDSLSKAIDIFTDMGKFTVAAKHHITVAEIYESDLNNTTSAITHYEQAADYYKGEESTSSANKCLLKVAGYAALLEQYTKSIEIYESIATNSMDSPLLKYSVKEYYFKAALCHFCMGESLDAKQALERYERSFAAFADSREYKLLQKLIEAYDKDDADEFAESIAQYDAISRIDQWLTTILLRIKKKICGEDQTDDLT